MKAALQVINLQSGFLLNAAHSIQVKLLAAVRRHDDRKLPVSKAKRLYRAAFYQRHGLHGLGRRAHVGGRFQVTQRGNHLTGGRDNRNMATVHAFNPTVACDFG